MSQEMPIFEWRPGMLVDEEMYDEQEDEVSVQFEERHINDEEEIVDGVDGGSVTLSDEKSVNEEFVHDNNNNIPEISDESDNNSDSLKDQDYEQSSDEYSDESDVETQE